MKRLISLIPALLALCAVSCSGSLAAEDEGAIERVPDAVSIRAQSENLWNKSDVISVFDAEFNKVNFKTVQDNVPAATFSTSAWTGKAPVYAAFCSRQNETTCTPDGVMGVFIKASQTSTKKGTCPKEGDASVGKITGSPGSYLVQMKSIAAFVKVNIKTKIVAKVNVTAIGGEIMNGYVDVDYAKLIAAEEPWWTPTDSKATNSSASLVAAGGACFDTGEHLVAILPGTYSKGLKITVYGDDSKPLANAVIGETEGVSLKRGESVSFSVVIDTSSGYEGVSVEKPVVGPSLDFD